MKGNSHCLRALVCSWVDHSIVFPDTIRGHWKGSSPTVFFPPYHGMEVLLGLIHLVSDTVFPPPPLPPKMATAVGIVLFTFQRLAKLFESCPTLCNPMDCSPPGFSVHGLLQARILEWVAMPFTRGSSQPRDWTQVSYISSISRHILYQ